MDEVCASALDLIGETPLVALDRLWPGPGRLLAKVELVNPGGSIKDRAARQIILDARASGALRPGQAVVEMTSGNMGAGLAVVCAVLGHPFTAVMSAGNSPERKVMLEALGAEVVLVPQVDGAPGEVTGADVRQAAREAKRLAVQRGAWYVDQLNHPGGPRAHESTTGPEILRQTGGQVSVFVAAVGSGGTFVGVSRFLKREAPGVRCYAVEPRGAEVLAGRPLSKPRHLLQGTGYGVVPPHWDRSLVDGHLAVEDGDAQRMRGELARREGLHVGYSAAANVSASLALLRSGRLPTSAVVVTILCDTGLKYGSDG